MRHFSATSLSEFLLENKQSYLSLILIITPTTAMHYTMTLSQAFYAATVNKQQDRDVVVLTC